MDRRKLLTSVAEQIDHIYAELGVQLQRMGQIQAQVDMLRAELKRLTG
jgi:hypothetical protein